MTNKAGVVKYTTVVLGQNGEVWDIGKGEYPANSVVPKDAFTCPVDKVPKSK